MSQGGGGLGTGGVRWERAAPMRCEPREGDGGGTSGVNVPGNSPFLVEPTENLPYYHLLEGLRIWGEIIAFSPKLS